MSLRNYFTDVNSLRILEFWSCENGLQLHFRVDLMCPSCSILGTEEIKHMLVVPSCNVMIGLSI